MPGEAVPAGEPEPKQKSPDMQDWKEKYLNNLEEHAETLKILMDAQRRIAELERQITETDAIMERLKRGGEPDNQSRAATGAGTKRLKKKAG